MENIPCKAQKARQQIKRAVQHRSKNMSRRDERMKFHWREHQVSRIYRNARVANLALGGPIVTQANNDSTQSPRARDNAKGKFLGCIASVCVSVKVFAHVLLALRVLMVKKKAKHSRLCNQSPGSDRELPQAAIRPTQIRGSEYVNCWVAAGLLGLSSCFLSESMA